MTKIYTRTGDRGETGLGDGSRVSKDELRVEAYGEVDELNAVLGVACAQARSEGRPLESRVREIQRDLFAIGAQLADPGASIASKKAKAAVTPEHIRRLEEAIDSHEAEMPPLRAFVLPGGCPLGASLHLARTVCRRAERTVVALARAAPVEATILAYLNRLSDLLFVLARHENRTRGQEEDTW